MDLSEDVICFLILTSSLPPTFDNPSIVSKDLEMFSGCADFDESVDKKLKANSFCPSNVSPSFLPSGDKLPCTPPSINNDADSDS